MDGRQAEQRLVSAGRRGRFFEARTGIPVPRPRQKALFELDGQWIGREVGKPFLYRYWHDAATGHSRRASLGTADLGEAKRRLAEIVVKGAPKDDDSALSIVLENYFTERTDHLPSAKPARNAGRLALEC